MPTLPATALDRRPLDDPTGRECPGTIENIGSNPTKERGAARMEAKARALVQRAVGADAFDERELALGFHWPPWYSVPWLHLHAIYPKSAMSRRWKYTAVSFYSPDRVREIIGRR